MAVALAGLCISATQAATGLDWLDKNTNLTVSADLRLRYEVDFDAHTATGAEQADRSRGRIRARLGAGYRLDDAWSVGARVRTGDSRSQQSPHLTFVTDEGDRDDLDFVVDRYFVQYRALGITAWGGRNLTPFWYQNELFWDEDVTPTGLAGTYDTSLGSGKLAAIAGGFYLPDGGYDLHGQMVAGQLKYTLPVKPSQFIGATGLHYMHGESGANNLRNRNGERDYLLGTGSLQWGIPVRGIPLTVGADVFYNFLDYEAADVLPFPVSEADQTLGYVFSVQFGQLRKRHHWLVGYYYSHIETFAVNASYAQDDWIRFGAGTQTDGSNFEGHEIRVGYAISSHINLLARLYLAEAITTPQDGNRFRLDLNWRF